MQIKTLYLDLLPDYIPFAVQSTDAAGEKTSPVSDNLIIYEEDGADATFSSSQVSGSPFNPAQINSKTGLWGILVDKTVFTAGKYYLALWELTVDGVDTAAVEMYFVTNASEMKADVSNLDAAVSSRSTLTAAQVWAEAGRELSTPAAYKADVSGLATEANATTNAAAVIAEVDANEVKIDYLTEMMKYLNGKTVFNVATVAVPARNVEVGMVESLDMSISATQVLHILPTYDSARHTISYDFTVV